jgi:hypothetical protein
VCCPRRPPRQPERERRRNRAATLLEGCWELSRSPAKSARVHRCR